MKTNRVLRLTLLIISFTLFGVSNFYGQSDSNIGQTPSSYFEQSELLTKINSYINPLVAANEFSGSILIAKGDSILFCRGYGFANRENGIINTPSTVYRIGSMTKQFTATAIMQLVEQNKLTTENKLSDFISDFTNGNKISIHQLLTHTSGIPNYTKLPDYNKTSTLPFTLPELINNIKYLPAEFEPGSKFKYNDSGYLLLTYIIEKISGLTYDQYLQNNIFKPLGMTNSGYDNYNKIINNRAAGYVFNSKTKEITNSNYIDMSIPQGAGGLYSTVLDLYKWDRSLYANNILSRESKEKMFTFNIADYGYGWGKEIRKGGRISIGHNGIINGFTSIIHRFINDDVVIIILANIEDVKVNEVFDKIPAIYFNEE
ncbi:MAG: serine hydrolase domain-containing protein [bacterium]